MMSSILFKVAGDEKRGLGHVIRSLELAREFEDFNVCFCCNDHPMVVKMIEKAGRTPIIIRGKIEQSLLEAIKKNAVKALVIDQPKPDFNPRVIKRAVGKILIVGLDYFRYSHQLDVIINLFNQNLKVVNPQQVVKNYYEGLEYAIIRDEFIEYAKKNKPIKQKVERILIAFGSADPCFHTKEALDLLAKLGKNEDIEIDVVVGPAFGKKTKELEHQHKNINLYSHVQNLGGLIFAADCGFCGAGTTLLEFCALGTPAIIMPQNFREKRFGKIFEERGAAVMLENVLPLQRKLKILHEVISDRGKRRSMSMKQKKLIDGAGKKRIKQIIVKHLEEG